MGLQGTPFFGALVAQNHQVVTVLGAICITQSILSYFIELIRKTSWHGSHGMAHTVTGNLKQNSPQICAK
jgi:hypothetical protein